MAANRSYKVTRIEDIMHDLVWDLEERAYNTRSDLDADVMADAAVEIKRLNAVVAGLVKALEDLLSCNLDHDFDDGNACGHYAQAKEAVAKAKST